MKRKVIQIAGSTCLVSLPKDWIKQHNVKKGAELDVQIENNKVIVSTNTEVQLESIKIDAAETDLFTLRALAAVYKSGFDDVNLMINDKSTLKDLSKDILAMPGYEIVDQQSNTCVIKNISQGLESEFETVLRKIFLITLSMSNHTLDAVKTNNFSKLQDSLILEETTNRFCNFCERLLNKKGYSNSKKTTFVYNIVWELEKVSDQLKYLNLYLMDRKSKLSKESVALLEKTHDMINTFYELFYKYDAKKVKKIAIMRKQMIKDCNKLFTSKNADHKVLHHVSNIAQMVFNMTGSYLGMCYK